MTSQSTLFRAFVQLLNLDAEIRMTAAQRESATQWILHIQGTPWSRASASAIAEAETMIGELSELIADLAKRRSAASALLAQAQSRVCAPLATLKRPRRRVSTTSLRA